MYLTKGGGGGDLNHNKTEYNYSKNMLGGKGHTEHVRGTPIRIISGPDSKWSSAVQLFLLLLAHTARCTRCLQTCLLLKTPILIGIVLLFGGEGSQFVRCCDT